MLAWFRWVKLMGLDAGFTWFPSPTKGPRVHASNSLRDIALIGSRSQGLKYSWRVLHPSLNKKRPVSHIFPTATKLVISRAAGTGEARAGHLGGVA